VSSASGAAVIAGAGARAFASLEG